MTTGNTRKWGITRRTLLVAGAALPTLHDRYGISAEAMPTSLKGWLR